VYRVEDFTLHLLLLMSSMLQFVPLSFIQPTRPPYGLPVRVISIDAFLLFNSSNWCGRTV
jgi:hypothetical protein